MMQHGSKQHHNGQDDTNPGLAAMDQALSPSWIAYTPGNWSWAERSDRAEQQAFRCMEDVRRKMIANAEKAMTSQMDFVSHRLNADMDCFRQLTTCRLPDETMKTLQGFFRTMWQDYENLAQRTFALMQDSVSDSVASAEALTETAVETVAALESAAEEEVALIVPSLAPKTEATAQPVAAASPSEAPAPAEAVAAAPAEAAKPAVKTAAARTSTTRKAPVRKSPVSRSPASKPAR